MSQGLEIQIIKAHLQKVSDTNKVVLYLVIYEIVEFELTEKEKAVATHMSASARCVGMPGASKPRENDANSTRWGEALARGFGPGAGRHGSGGRGLGAMSSPRRE